MRGGLARNQRIKQTVEHDLIGHAIRVVDKARVLDPLRVSHYLRQAPKQSVAAGGNHHLTVACRIGLVRGNARSSRALFAW